MPLTPTEIHALRDLPVPELLFRAATAHRAHWNVEKVLAGGAMVRGVSGMGVVGARAQT
jgi:biotin synthase-like enzyme